MTEGRVWRWRRWWLAPVAALAVISAVTACGSTPADQPAAAASAAPGSDGAADQAKPVDVCALLTTDEVTQILGAKGGTDPQARDNGNGGGSCVWENPDTYHSITISIGSPGTAVGGELPEDPDVKTEPGPDGIRLGSGGMARFAANDRACDIQVVTKVTDDTDESTAIRLIGLVRDRIR
jgi:hypothetical protein